MLPDLPARDAHHHAPPHAVRRDTEPADHPAAAGGARAVADADRPEGPRPGPARPVQRPRSADQGVAHGPAGARAGARRHPPAAGRVDPFLRNVKPILDYLGLYRREIAALLRARRRRHPGHRPAARRARGRCTTCAPPTRSTRRSWPPIRDACRPTARTPTPSPAATSSSPPRATSRSSAATSAPGRPSPPPPLAAPPLLSAELADLVEPVRLRRPGEHRRRAALRPAAPLGRLVGQAGMLPPPATAASRVTLS